MTPENIAENNLKVIEEEIKELILKIVDNILNFYSIKLVHKKKLN